MVPAIAAATDSHGVAPIPSRRRHTLRDLCEALRPDMETPTLSDVSLKGCLVFHVPPASMSDVQ